MEEHGDAVWRRGVDGQPRLSELEELTAQHVDKAHTAMSRMLLFCGLGFTRRVSTA